jgi:hypothetical protein
VDSAVSNCWLDGNANGIQQQFDNAKYSACERHNYGQIAYSQGFTLGCTQAGNAQQMCAESFTLGCTQAGNAQQMCTALVQPNTGLQSTPNQPPTTTQPTLAIPPTG